MGFRGFWSAKHGFVEVLCAICSFVTIAYNRSACGIIRIKMGISKTQKFLGWHSLENIEKNNIDILREIG
jgi:hypothetical protein